MLAISLVIATTIFNIIIIVIIIDAIKLIQLKYAIMQLKFKLVLNAKLITKLTNDGIKFPWIISVKNVLICEKKIYT